MLTLALALMLAAPQEVETVISRTVAPIVVSVSDTSHVYVELGTDSLAALAEKVREDLAHAFARCGECAPPVDYRWEVRAALALATLVVYRWWTRDDDSDELLEDEDKHDRHDKPRKGKGYGHGGE